MLSSQHMKSLKKGISWGSKLCVWGFFCAFFASRMYVPIPGDIEEYWKVTALDIFAKTCTFMVSIVFFPSGYWNVLLTKNQCL